MSVGVGIRPLRGIPEVRAGDDLGSLLLEAAERTGVLIADGDVLAVTQKVVSKAEGRVVPEEGGKLGWVAREAARVVARRGDLIIAETRHGFVCANAGVDRSNVAIGFVSLLPEDPDGSAERLRTHVAHHTGADAAVVITDTFGRPWRKGLVNVAIGAAGLSSLIDLRGTPDAEGRTLEVTEVALADEVAAAAGLVMGKADRVPAAVVTGLTGADLGPLPASALVREGQEDLFRLSPLETVRSLPVAPELDSRPVPHSHVEAAAEAAAAAVPGGPAWALGFAVAPQRTGPGPAAAGGVSPGLVALCALPRANHGDGAPAGRAGSFALEAGMAVQAFRVALFAQGLASSWLPIETRRGLELRQSLGLPEEWHPFAVVTPGWPRTQAPRVLEPTPTAEIRWIR
jgi:coenzyme F420-0:L-glutamate ligase / coenzyme F420-1:gamma-L-glutamate ligase